MAKVPNLNIIDVNLDEHFISMMENHNNEDVGYIRRSKGTLKQSLPGTCVWDVTCKGYYPQVNRIISSSGAISEERVLTDNDVFEFQQHQTEQSDEVAEKLKGNGVHEENNIILEISYLRRVRKNKRECNCKTVNIEMVAGHRGQDPVDELVKYINNGDKSYGNKDKESKTKIPNENGKNINGKTNSKKCLPKSTAISSGKHEKDKRNENKNWNKSTKELKRQQLKKTPDIFKNGAKNGCIEIGTSPKDEKINLQKPVPKMPFMNHMHVEHARRIMNDLNNLLNSGNYTIIRE